MNRDFSDSGKKKRKKNFRFESNERSLFTLSKKKKFCTGWISKETSKITNSLFISEIKIIKNSKKHFEP